MIIAVASGKGGTGKTMVSASLASVWKRPLLAVDMDVEEPNLALFLKPEALTAETVHQEIPVLDPELCTLCNACTDLCQFKGISRLGPAILTFPELCHGCGGCIRICPQGALGKGKRALGEVESGRNRDGIQVLTGRLRIGEAQSTPLMGHVRRRMQAISREDALDTLIDGPPGVSCPAMMAVQDADAILLVTEPTPFGLYDLQLARKAFLPLWKPMGVFVNRAGVGDAGVRSFCREAGLPILAELPFRRDVALAYAQGGLAAQVDDALGQVFRELAQALENLVSEARTANHA